jgi:hypothetical protein
MDSKAEIGTQVQPLISNEIFKETLDSLNRGETEFYELIVEEYTLESNQKLLAASKYDKLKGK